MHLQIFKNCGKEYVRTVEFFRDTATKLRVIQNFGNKKLLAGNPKTLQELQKIVTDENGTALILRLKDFPDTEAAIPAREDPPLPKPDDLG